MDSESDRQPVEGAGPAPGAPDGAGGPGAPPHHFHLGLGHHGGHAPAINRVLSTLLICVVAGLIPWTIWLGLSLPQRYSAHNWSVVWIGFDAALIAVLAYTAWAMWFRRQIMVSTAMVAGTLLACDAWFDVVTSFGSKGAWLPILTALGGELPLAIFFFWVGSRIMRMSIAAYHRATGQPGPPPRLRDAMLVSLPTNPPSREAGSSASAPRD